MAVIEHLGMSMELSFKTFDPELWVKGEIIMRHADKLVFRDEDLKRSPAGWADRSPGAMLFNEHREQTFLPTLRRALDERQPQYWKPIEPDMIVCFYPDGRFPMMPPQAQPIYEAPHIVKERIERDNLRQKAGGVLANDDFAIFVFADAYNWYSSYCYEEQGFGMLFRPTWEKVHRFYLESQAEWEAFVISQNIEERIAESDRMENEAFAEQDRMEREWEDKSGDAKNES